MLFCWDLYNRIYHSRHSERQVKKNKEAHIWNQIGWCSFDTLYSHSGVYTAPSQARSLINWLGILKFPLMPIPE